MPVFMSTAVAPSSIATAASLAVPTPGVDDHRHLHALEDDAQVGRIADAETGSDRRRERHHRGAAERLEALTRHRVVGDVGAAR
jgi:hypothetical protein